VDAWAAGSDNASVLFDRDALTLQLAEANLRAGRFRRARELFESLAETQEASTAGRTLTDSRVVLGHAEALFQLGAFDAALPQFNRLATGLPPSDPIRWKALLRDLQCRTELKEPAQGIIKVIHQQRHLYPDLGGPELAPVFEKLLWENERRAD
jgi:tetratricopeptide (TPR) repeat protein